MSEKLETLNVVQQVLRGVVVSLAATQRVDPFELSTLLAGASQQPHLDPMAQQMLADLAQGLAVISKAKSSVQ